MRPSLGILRIVFHVCQTSKVHWSEGVNLIGGLLSFGGLANMENAPWTTQTGYCDFSLIKKNTKKTVTRKTLKIWDTLPSTDHILYSKHDIDFVWMYPHHQRQINITFMPCTLSNACPNMTSWIESKNPEKFISWDMNYSKPLVAWIKSWRLVITFSTISIKLSDDWVTHVKWFRMLLLRKLPLQHTCEYLDF